VTITEQDLTEMNEIHLLVDSHDVVAIAAFTDKALVEAYEACSDPNDCQECASLAALGLEYPIGELYAWTVTLWGRSFVHELKYSRENAKTTQIHAVSNGFGEFLWAFTDKRLAEEIVAYLCEHTSPCCEFFQSRGELCPCKPFQIDTVELDNPSLIQHCKERIARVQDGCSPVEMPGRVQGISRGSGRGRVRSRSKPILTPRSTVYVCLSFAFTFGSSPDGTA
jgi:hypothetical protein